MKAKSEVMKDLAKVRRRKIVIQKKTDGFDEIGNPVEKWDDWKTLRVERTSLWGREYYAARAVNEENTIEYTAKYVPFLDELNTVEYRIIDGKKIFDIKHIDPLKDDGMWLKIKALQSGVVDDG